ncbi:sensor histidine kinase [Pedobacter sp. GR22-6]|uniref:sensor histidine kinase n=1 Tax=Pedobacter sp. GR22-6 TaxID=3127957 RepID=UPI00307F9916
MNTSILHMYLAGAIWADRKYGTYAIFSNLLMFGFIYYQTLHAPGLGGLKAELGDPLYPLVMHCLISVFFGGFLAYLQLDQDRDRNKIKALQDQKISMLDEAVKKRTEQLNTMRETIATDFHDETGNTLSAITRQAILLQQKLKGHREVNPIVESIIRNSKNLYAASKDFLWNLNHNSDDPQELFEYLTGYGQVYYNQFDMPFSSRAEECRDQQQLEPMAALNIIYIFKEAMTNVIKHAEAREVRLEMTCTDGSITYALEDDGTWKAVSPGQPHYGLGNMERRSQKNRFEFKLVPLERGTRIELRVPLSPLT